jgi:phage head maturation protease
VDKLEYKSVPLELSDLSIEHRTAVIAHATYDNIDLLDDISRAGMFTKSWNEHKADIGFLVNHDPKLTPGIVEDVFEDKAHGYTKVRFGKHTMGNDYLEMTDMGIIKDASFGFKAIKFNKLNIKGKKIRELKEVYHGETTLVHGMTAINPESGVVLVKKAMDQISLELKSLTSDEQSFLKKLVDGTQSNLETAINFARTMDQTSDLYTWIMYYITRQADGMSGVREQLKWNTKAVDGFKAHITKLESFCRNTKASDGCIENILQEAKALQQLVSSLDTANTLDGEPDASDKNDEDRDDMTNVLAQISLLTQKTSLS